ncbi:MAG: hypothetical protein K8U57_32735 [Planctomycetes bacterium]|nr:hypothetical protein [Planctomycetota bacterium]
MFRPKQHKTQHHGRDRVVLIGPQAREILQPFLAAAEPYLFSPLAAELDRNATRRENRASPMTPSQAVRKPRDNPKRPKRERYDETSYRNAVYRACDKVFPPPPSLARRTDETIRLWKPRHTSACGKLLHDVGQSITDIRTACGTRQQH